MLDLQESRECEWAPFGAPKERVGQAQFSQVPGPKVIFFGVLPFRFTG